MSIAVLRTVPVCCVGRKPGFIVPSVQAMSKNLKTRTVDVFFIRKAEFRDFFRFSSKTNLFGAYYSSCIMLCLTVLSLSMLPLLISYVIKVVCQFY